MKNKRKKLANEKSRLRNIFAFWCLHIFYDYPYSKYEKYTVRDFFEEFGFLQKSKYISLNDYHALDHYGQGGLKFPIEHKKQLLQAKKDRMKEIKERKANRKKDIFTLLRNL
jgi:hypothetical protein